ncbi:MAG: tyrosine-type recombinase/integrase [Dehalococcoidia bacterium]|nr:tyrosine-type recombinase/integrase [Dehalococcoidia bacterium]
MQAYLIPEEVTRMEEAATNLRDRLLIRLLSRLGCRVSEAVALTVPDIDLQNGTVVIQHLKTRLKLTCPCCDTRLGRSHAFCPKCGVKVEEAVAQAKENRRLRTLHLDRDTLQMLRDYIRRGGPVSRDGKQLIFGINRHRAWQVVSDCAEKAGLNQLVNPETGRLHGVSPHRLRDAFAVMAVQQDDSTDGVRMLQEWLGHASIGTTMRYRKVESRELEEWYRKLWDKKETSRD